MSNLNKWNDWYKEIEKSSPSAFRYADTITYKLGATYLEDCETVEDWGCGVGGFKRFREDSIGVDGSLTPFADKIEDLELYSSSCDGIFMRHVLEHNENWEKILKNALKSFKKKMCLVVFTDFSEDETKVLADNKEFGVDVKDLSLNRKKFTSILKKFKVTEETLHTETGYGIEHIFYIKK